MAFDEAAQPPIHILSHPCPEFISQTYTSALLPRYVVDSAAVPGRRAHDDVSRL